MAKLRGFVALVLIGLVVCLGAARSPASDSLETRLGFYICPNVTTTIYPQTPDQNLPGCGSPVVSPNSNNPSPGGNPCEPPTGNTDLGAFTTSQNPLGAFVASGAPNKCATNPPTLGRGAGNAAFSVSVAQRGFCPTTLTVAAHEGPVGGVFFPIGTLPLGTYDLTVTLPAQTVNEPNGPVAWLGVQVSGTLRVGTMFRETERLAAPSKNFATLLQNSFAGPGAGNLMLKKNVLSGTEYYACGTINITAGVTFRKRGSVRGKGVLVDGTGNYNGIKGTFTLTGSYNAKTKRGAFTLKGAATY